MEPAGPAEIIKILSGMAVFKRIPNVQSQEQVNFFLSKYAERLREYGIETIQKAADEIVDTDPDGFFPQVAFFKKAADYYHSLYRDDLNRLNGQLRITPKEDSFKKDEMTPELEAILEKTYKKLQAV